MKQPRLKTLKLDKTETKRIRTRMAKGGSVKITINIDADTLKRIRSMSDDTGVPYQRLLNNLLKQSLQDYETTETRLSRLEKELKQIKRRLAA